jgi:hypothetical protein
MLKTATPRYSDIGNVLTEKSSLTKMVYTTLRNVFENGNILNYTYDDLIEDLGNVADNYDIPEFSEQLLLNSGKFIIGQVRHYFCQKNSFIILY